VTLSELWYLPAVTRTVRDLAVGESAVLAEPQLAADLRMRLAEMGVRPGEQVRLSQRGVGGARIISVRGSRVALDASTAGNLPIADGSSA